MSTAAIVEPTEIKVEERRLKLDDYLKTAVKINWSFTTEKAREKLKNRHAELPKINASIKMVDH